MKFATINNLGNEFDLGVIEANKVHIRLDNRTIRKDALNTIHARPTHLRVTATTAVANDVQIVSVANSATAVTITLPNAPQTGTVITVKRVITAVGGVASTGTVTVIGAGVTRIENYAGAVGATALLNVTTFRRATWMFNGTFWEWLST